MTRHLNSFSSFFVFRIHLCSCILCSKEEVAEIRQFGWIFDGTSFVACSHIWCEIVKLLGSGRSGERLLATSASLLLGCSLALDFVACASTCALSVSSWMVIFEPSGNSNLRKPLRFLKTLMPLRSFAGFRASNDILILLLGLLFLEPELRIA